MNHLHRTAQPPRSRPRPRASLPSHFTSLYRSHHDFVWRCALRLGGDESEVDDLVQETFLVALRRLDEFEREGPAQPSTWLFAILRNVLRNHRRGERRRARRHERLAELQPEIHEPEQAARYAGLRELERFIASLPAPRRAVFVLAELEGHTSKEIGAALGINPTTARTRLRSARLAFDRAFADEGQALLASAREQAPKSPAGKRERNLQAIAVFAWGELPKLGAATPAPITVWASASKLVSGVLALVGVGLLLSASPSEPRAKTKATTERAPLVAPPQAPPSATQAKLELESVELRYPSPASEAPTRAAPRRRNPRPTSTTVEDQLRRIADARGALIAGRPQDSLRTLEHSETWSRESLAAQARGLQVGALCALGRESEAKQRAEAWRAQHPARPLDTRAEGLCW